jgi:hypothetical protein
MYILGQRSPALLGSYGRGHRMQFYRPNQAIGRGIYPGRSTLAGFRGRRARSHFNFLADDASDYESQSVADYFTTSQPLAPVEVAPSLATGNPGSTSWNYTGPTSNAPIQSTGSIYGGLPNAGPGYASSAAVPGSVPVGGGYGVSAANPYGAAGLPGAPVSPLIAANSMFGLPTSTVLMLGAAAVVLAMMAGQN